MKFQLKSATTKHCPFFLKFQNFTVYHEPHPQKKARVNQSTQERQDHPNEHAISYEF